MNSSSQQQQPSAPHQPQPPHQTHSGPLDPRLGPSTAIPPSHSAPTVSHHSTPPTNNASANNTLAPFPAPAQYADQSARRPLHLQPSPAASKPTDSTVGSAYASPQPYYNYLTPHSGEIPQSQLSAGAASASSNQTSPDGYVPHADPGSPEHIDGQHPDDPKRQRACEACRGLKVRCDQDPAHPEIPCKRCAKAGRQCVITQPSRKRQKKGDSRVAELEKKLDALTAVLQQQQTLPPSNPQYAPLSAGSASQPSPLSPTSGTQLPPLQTHTRHQPASLPSLVRTASDHSHTHEPAYKRRRTDDTLTETPTLDGAGVEVPVTRLPPSPRTARQAMAQQYHSQHDPWGPNAEIRRYLDRSPQELCNRVHSLIPPGLEIAIFNRFVTDLAPSLPVIVFPPHVTADQIRKEKPILYVCILSASAFGVLHPDASKQLSMEAVGAIADSVVRNGNKSLELVQALQVLALWYRPPERADQTNFYQIIHMAAAMALDIGLGKHFNAMKARRGFGGPYQNFTPYNKTLPQDSDALDARRAWLGCYYLCASASMVLRRPNMVRWSNYMTECIEVLENAPGALLSDKLLCQHIKISHICEDIGLQFLMDDNTASVSIQDPKVAYQLNVLEGQLKSWKDKIPPDCRIPSLQFFEHVTNLYLHEIALHLNHNVDDFRLPFTEESLKSVNSGSDALTQHQMAALEACQKAAHGILDTMLSFDIQVVQALPMLIFVVRCIYAVVILVKMHVAINTPGSELAKFMKADALRVDYYLERLLEIYRVVAKDESFIADTKVVRILTVLHEWYQKHKANVEAQARGEPAPFPSTGSPVEQPHAQVTKPGQTQTQTPLHLLSQVATGNPPRPSPQQSQPPKDRPASGNQDWTFPNPYIIDYTQMPHPSNPISRTPFNRQWSANSNPTPTPNSASPAPQRATSYQSGSDAPQQQQQQKQQTVQPPQSNPQAGTSVFPYESNGGGGNGTGFGDMGDYGWGSGFEQAMDMAMGGVDGLAADGLDTWFLGDAMAPFAFNGDVGPTTAAVGGQW